METVHQVEAYNTALTSENKIHDDETAKKFGFQGGLVPGVEVFAYMSHAPVAEWGTDWLERGGMEARFGKPVYDGHKAFVQSELDPNGEMMEIELESLGQKCANGRAYLTDKPAFEFEAKNFERQPLPGSRPKASPLSLEVGKALGTVDLCWDENSATHYLKDIMETAPIYRTEKVCHTGFLLRAANSALSQNVELGPWIHVGSHIQNHAAASLNEPLIARSFVRRNYENKGHLFVELDVLISGTTDRPIASIQHTAIYEPRQVREAK